MLILGRRHRIRIAAGQAKLPAAAHGSIRLDQPQRDFPLRLGQGVLLLHQILLQQGEPRQIRRAGVVLSQHDFDGLLGVGHAGRLFLGALLGKQEADQAVLHILIGAEDRVLIGRHQLLEPGVLEANIIQEPAIVEDVPLKRRADRP